MGLKPWCCFGGGSDFAVKEGVPRPPTSHQGPTAQAAVSQAAALACNLIVASPAKSGLPRVAHVAESVVSAFGDGRVALFGASRQACVFSSNCSGESTPAICGLGTALFDILSEADVRATWGAADGLTVVRSAAWHDCGLASTQSNSSALLVPLPPRRDHLGPGTGTGTDSHPAPGPKRGSSAGCSAATAPSQGGSGPLPPAPGPLCVGPGDLLALPLHRNGKLAGALLLGWVGPPAGACTAPRDTRAVAAAADGGVGAPHPGGATGGGAGGGGGGGGKGGGGCGVGGSWVLELRSADVAELRRLAQLVGFGLLADPEQALYLEQVATLLCQLTDPDCPGLHDLVAAVLDAMPPLLYGRCALALQPILAAVPAAASAPTAAVFFSRRPHHLPSSSLQRLAHPHQQPHQHPPSVLSPVLQHSSFGNRSATRPGSTNRLPYQPPDGGGGGGVAAAAGSYAAAALAAAFNAPGLQPGVSPAMQRLMLDSIGGGAGGGGLPRSHSTQSLAFGGGASALDSAQLGTGGGGGVSRVKAVHSALAHTLLQRALMAGARASNAPTGANGLNGSNGLNGPNRANGPNVSPCGGAPALVVVVADASGQVLEEEQPGRDVLLAANLTGAGVASLLLCAEAQGQGLQGHRSPGHSRPQSQAQVQGQGQGALRGALQAQLGIAAAAAGAAARAAQAQAQAQAQGQAPGQAHGQARGPAAVAVSPCEAHLLDLSVRGGRDGQAGQPPRRRFPSVGGVPQQPVPPGIAFGSSASDFSGSTLPQFSGDMGPRALWCGGAAPPSRLALYLVSAEAVPAGVLEAAAAELRALMPVVFAALRSAIEAQPLLAAEWRHLAEQQHQRATASGLIPATTPTTPAAAAAPEPSPRSGSGVASPGPRVLAAASGLPSPRLAAPRAAVGAVAGAGGGGGGGGVASPLAAAGAPGPCQGIPQRGGGGGAAAVVSPQQRGLLRTLISAVGGAASPLPGGAARGHAQPHPLGSALAPVPPPVPGGAPGRWLRNRPAPAHGPPPALLGSSPPVVPYVHGGRGAGAASASFLRSGESASCAGDCGEGEEVEGAADAEEDVLGLMIRTDVDQFAGCYTRRRSRALARLPSCPALQLEEVSGRRPLELLVSSARSRLTAVAAGQEAGEEARQVAQQDLSAVELLEVVGRGGQGVVFRGSLHGLEVAVKVLEHVGRSPLEHEGVSMSPYPAPTAPTAAAAGSSAADAGATEVPAGGGAANVETLRKFKREALEVAVMTTLSHPNIVQVFAEFSEAVVVEKHASWSSGPGGVPQAAGHAPKLRLCSIDSPLLGGRVPSPLNSVLCLEYCDAGTLLAAARRGDFRLAGTGPRDGPVWPDLVPLYTSLLEVALALRYLHSRRLVHCDLKPGNVLLRANARDARGWTCKLSDFGCVRLMDEAGPEGQPGFTIAEVYGTLPYMAPEIYHKGLLLTAAVDVYAFGLVMWELLHCRSAFSKVKHNELPALVVRQNLRPEFHPLSPHDYSSLAALCWSAAPERRPTAAHLVTTLQQLLAAARAAAARQQLRQQQHRQQHQQQHRGPAAAAAAQATQPRAVTPHAGAASADAPHWAAPLQHGSAAAGAQAAAQRQPPAAPDPSARPPLHPVLSPTGSGSGAAALGLTGCAGGGGARSSGSFSEVSTLSRPPSPRASS